MSPSCPQFYTCTFTPDRAHVIVRNLDPWYQQTGGLVVAILAIIVFGICLLVALFGYHQRRTEKQSRQQSFLERERERQNKLAVEEQRTMQIDACKGNPDMLKLVRELQR